MKIYEKKRAGARKRRVLAMVMSCMALILGMAVPAQAANGTETITFKKHLVMQDTASVPNTEFSFTITAGAAIAAAGSDSEIYAGNDAARVTGFPTIGTAEFAAADSTTAESTTAGKPDDTAPENPTAGWKYATKEVTVDFSGVSFSDPGIYRYIISEKPSSSGGITNDAVNTRTLDVQVGYTDDNATELEIIGEVLYLGTLTGNTGFEKSEGFTNTYTTYDLTLKKQVTGNQGNRSKYFEFTVAIEDAAPGTVYTVDLAQAENAPAVDGNTKNNAGTLTVGSDGKVSGTFYLKHDQFIIIQDLVEGTKYTITETVYSADGYTTTYVLDSNAPKTANTTGEQTMGQSNHTVVFENKKEGTVPTGILLETAPYLILGVLVLASFTALVATRRRRSR